MTSVATDRESWRLLTIAFVDIVGSTPLSVSIDGDDYAEVIDAYRRAALPLIERHGGFLGGDEGDGRFIWFGWPRAADDDAERAVRMALDLRESIKALAVELQASLGIDLSARIGLHTGEIILRTEHGRRPNLVGAAANVAAKVQAETPPGTVCVSEATASLVGRRFQLEPAGQLTIAGLAGELDLYTVLEEAPTRPDETVTTGRDAELSRLGGLWDGVASGGVASVLVLGEAGIGKSRLAWSFVEEHCEGVSRLAVQADSYRQDDSFGVLIDALRDSDLKFSETDLGQLLDASRRDQAMRGLLDAIAGAARSQPILVLVEDAHWLDHSTAELLGRLVEAEVPGLFMLVTTRLNATAMTSTAFSATITLGPLTAECLAEVVRQTTEGLDDKAVEDVIERAAGNPFFAKALALAHDAETGHGARRALLPHSEVPIVVQQALRARLEGSEAAADLSATAAVIGREFTVGLLEASHPGPPLDRAHLDWLVDAAVIEPVGDGGTYRFQHALIHQLAYDLLVRASRRRRHSEVADALAEAGTASVALLGFHYERAGRFAEAAAAKLTAAEDARRSGAFREATDLAGQVLHLVEDPEVDADHDLERRALEVRSVVSAALDHAGYRAGELDRERLNGLLDPGLDGGAIVRSLTREYASAMVMSDLARAGPLLRRMQHLSAGDHTSVTVTRLLRGTYMMYRGNLAYAERLLTASTLELADLGLHPEFRATWATADDPVSVGLSRLPPLLWMRGRKDRAEAILHRAETEAETVAGPGAAMSAAHVKVNAAMYHELAGDGPMAMEVGQEVVEIGHELALAFWEQTGHLHRQLGAAIVEPTPAGLETLVRTAREREAIARIFSPMVYLQAADGYRRLGDPASALGAVEAAGAIARDTGAWWLWPEVLRLEAGCRAEPDARVRLLTDSTRVARRQGARVHELRSLADLIELDPSAGVDGVPVRTLAEEALAGFPTGQDYPELPRLTTLLG